MEFWRFEDLIAWQKARKLVFDIYQVSKKGDFATDFRFRDQIRAAAVSVMANIAEGSESGSTREFIRYLNIAKPSCGEVRSHLYVALDQNYLDENQFAKLREQSIEVTKLVLGLRASLLRKLSGKHRTDDPDP